MMSRRHRPSPTARILVCVFGIISLLLCVAIGSETTPTSTNGTDEEPDPFQDEGTRRPESNGNNCTTGDCTSVEEYDDAEKRISIDKQPGTKVNGSGSAETTTQRGMAKKGLNFGRSSESAISRLPPNIDRKLIRNSPLGQRVDVDKLAKRFGGNIQLPNFQSLLGNVSQHVLAVVVQGNPSLLSADALKQMEDLIPKLESSIFCPMNDSQRQAAIDAAMGDCSRTLGAAEAKEKLPGLGSMLWGMSRTCPYTLRNGTYFAKVAKCANQLGSAHKASALQFLRGLFALLPKDPTFITKDMLNAAGADNAVKLLPVDDICRMNQTTDILLSSVRARLDSLRISTDASASETRRLQAIGSCLTVKTRGPLVQWNSSILSLELSNLYDVENLRQLNPSSIDANLRQIKGLIEGGRLSVDQQAILSEVWSQTFNPSGMTVDQLRDLINNKLAPSFLCRMPDAKFNRLKSAATIDRNVLRDFRSKFLNAQTCRGKFKSEVVQACLNKANETAFEGLVSANNEILRNRTCAAHGSYADFVSVTKSILTNATDLGEKVVFWRSLADDEVKQNAFVQELLRWHRVRDGKLDVQQVADEILHYVAAAEIDAANNASFCERARVWLREANEMDVAQRTAVTRKMVTACGWTFKDMVTSVSVPSPLRALVSGSAAKEEIIRGRLTLPALRDATKDFPCGSSLRRCYIEMQFGTNSPITAANIASDPRLICSLECQHIQSIGDSQILGYISDVCLSGQPVKPKTVGCLKEKLCQYVERILSTDVGAATDDFKCMARLSAPHLDGLCFQIFSHFGKDALSSLTGDKCLAAARKVSVATTEYLIRYPYETLNVLATTVLRCLGGESGNISESVIGDIGCSVAYLNPSDISRLTSEATTRSLDCFGKAPRITQTGLVIMPVISTSAAAVICQNIIKSDGPEANWTSATFQKLGCVAEFCDISKMSGIADLSCSIPPVPDYLLDEAAEMKIFADSSLDPQNAFNWTLAAEQVMKKKISLRQNLLSPRNSTATAS